MFYVLKLQKSYLLNLFSKLGKPRDYWLTSKISLFSATLLWFPYSYSPCVHTLEKGKRLNFPPLENT